MKTITKQIITAAAIKNKLAVCSLQFAGRKNNLHFLANCLLPIAHCLLPVACCLLPTVSSAQSNAVPFTLEDRDRIMQTQKEVASLRNEMNTRFESIQKEMNTRFESLQKEMNTRFESQQRQIDDIKTLFYWGFGMMMSLMLFLLGYTIWDRKTVTEPIREHTQSLIQSLREYAKEQPKLADILRSHGLL